MNCARNNLFACAGFARYQDRCAGSCNALGHRHEALQRWAAHNRRHTLQKLRVGIS